MRDSILRKVKQQPKTNTPKAAKACESVLSPILLLFPPGWTYTTGGANFALPLLRGYLENQNIETHLVDLNIGLSDYFDLKISPDDLAAACEVITLESLNSPYYMSQDRMDEVSAPHDATWDIQVGLVYKTGSVYSSEDVRTLSELSSPFDSFYEKTLLQTVRQLDPLIIGISVCTSSQLLTTFQIVRFLRKSGFDGKIILGGNLVTRLGSDIVKEWVFELIDGAVLFQGEVALTTLYFALLEGKDLHNIPNLIWKNNTRIVENKIEYLRPGSFGRPSYRNLSFNSYWGVNYIPVLGSRGCYYGKCTFCAIPYGYGADGFLGHDDPGRVYSDMISGFEISGINKYKFMEEALHPAIIKKLSEKIIAENFDCEFEGYARLDSFWRDEQFLKKVSTAGLRKVYLGLELIASDKRGLLNKSDSDKALDFLKKFSDAGIKTHVFTLFGFPGTGVDEAISTIEFALKHKDLIDTLDIFPFYYSRHTTVPFVEIVEDKRNDWAMEYKYKPTEKWVLTMEQTSELCDQLEGVLWNEIPKWLHPTYRLFSPWSITENKKQTISTNRLVYA